MPSHETLEGCKKKEAPKFLQLGFHIAVTKLLWKRKKTSGTLLSRQAILKISVLKLLKSRGRRFFFFFFLARTYLDSCKNKPKVWVLLSPLLMTTATQKQPSCVLGFCFELFFSTSFSPLSFYCSFNSFAMLECIGCGNQNICLHWIYLSFFRMNTPKEEDQLTVIKNVLLKFLIHQ